MQQNAAVVSQEAATTPQKRGCAQRGRVKVFSHWCKGCGLCTAFCPQHVFEPNGGGQPIVAHPERCTACDWCRFHCPDLAITVAHLDESDTGGRA